MNNSPIKGYDAVGLKVGFEDFYAKRDPNDVDLITLVREALSNSGLHTQVLDAFDTHPYIIEALDKSSVVQKFNLNRYWLCQLVMLHNVDTMGARQFLLLSGTTEVWIQAFTTHLLPFIIQHGLPFKLTE